MTRILFVEDHLGLIEELTQLLFRMRRSESPILRFATSVEQAVNRLLAEPFDVVVADVMLPSHPGVPTHDEGIYLAAWILGHIDALPVSLKDCERSAWLKAGKCCPVLLTSRTAEGIRNTYQELTGEDAASILIIERLGMETNEQAKKILEIAECGAKNA